MGVDEYRVHLGTNRWEYLWRQWLVGNMHLEVATGKEGTCTRR